MSDVHDEHEQRLIDRMEHEARLDADKEKMVRMGMLPACPECGSHRYVEGVKAEVCSDCGYGQSYW